MSNQVVIVGTGEIGRRFAGAAQAQGLRFEVVSRERNQQLLGGPSGVPLLVCVREDDLVATMARVPVERARDVIFVQNGFIDEVVARYPGSTRAVLWFTSKGTFFADVLQSPVFGPRQDLVRGLINAVGASAEALVDPDVFRRYALEKAVWSCVVGAPLFVWGTDLATARHQRMGDIHAIVDEACAVVGRELNADISPQRVMAVLDDTSTTLGWMKGSSRGLAYRNGKVVEWGLKHGVATPANAAVVEGVRRVSERVAEAL